MASVEVTQLSLEVLVNGGQLTPADDSPHPAWMVPLASDREPNPHKATSSALSVCTSAASMPR
jgi:hypothetical protein